MPTDVQAVWSPRNLSAPVEKIKSGIVQFGDTIRALRDSWKDKNESLKKAELPHSSTAAHATQLKADVAHYRQIVETVINRSLQHAHPAILKRYVKVPLCATHVIFFRGTPPAAYQVATRGTVLETVLEIAARANGLDMACEHVGWLAWPSDSLQASSSSLPLDSLHVYRRRVIGDNHQPDVTTPFWNLSVLIVCSD
jgi:hypothetical protein